MDFGLEFTIPNQRMGLGVETTLSSTSCELSSSESEDVVPINDKSTSCDSSATRKSFSHTVDSTSLADFRSLPLLKDRLEAICDRQIHCDVIFHVGPGKDIVKAHRIVLTSASEIFEKIFYDPTKKSYNSSDKYIYHEPDYSPESFQIFIKAMYTNEFPQNLSLSIALEIFYASKKYHVIFLEEKVLNHILQNVSIENVFEALKISTNSIELTKIVPICWKIIEEDTSKVLSTHLDHLDEYNFTRVLSRDHLNIEEVELFQFLVKWGSVQCKKRGLKTTGKNKRQLIDHLLKYIRFSTIHSMDFNDIVIPSRILEPKEIFALQSHISPSNITATSHHNCSESKVSLPYNSRPRFKPRISTLRRPDSLTNNSLLSSQNDNPPPDGGDTQIEKNQKTTKRPKKLSRKLATISTKPLPNGFRSYR